MHVQLLFVTTPGYSGIQNLCPLYYESKLPMCRQDRRLRWITPLRDSSRLLTFQLRRLLTSPALTNHMPPRLERKKTSST